jgi:Protein of unknown function (DUF3093)
VSTYAERLTVPWWAWPTALGGASFLAAELAIGAMQLRQPLTFIIACVAAGAGLFALSRVRVSVANGELRVDDARLPVEFIGAVEVIDLEARRDLLGPEADPLAFVVQRPWLPGGVRIDLDDPTDPTPYWYVSSRRPRQLAAALLEARNAAAVLPA